MAKDISIGIAGATGVVGSELINILTERDFNCSNVRLFASKNSAGELYSVCGQEVTVEQLDEAEFDGLDLVFLAAGGSVSEEYAPKIVEAGAVVIDKSSFFRMNDDVPLVVPEVNGSALTKENRIIATPNCSTIQLVPVLKVIHEAAGLKRVILSTYQAVSGAGKNAMDELWEQTRAIYAQEELEHEAFAHQIAFNCIPHIDTLLDDGYSKEEMKMVNESRKILDLPDLKITATAVRVPVFNCHGESVNIETERELLPETLVKLLDAAEGIEVYPNMAHYPMHMDCSGTDEIHVGRIRKDPSVENGLDLWIVADNLRKGAALNAVQIAEYLVENVL